jgi:surface antigen
MHIRSSSYGRLGWVRLVLCSVFLSNAVAAYAANLGFLTDTPISYMKQRDLQQLNRAARTALDSKQDGEALDWNNVSTGNPVHVEGTITPLNTQKDGDRSCRTLAIVAKAKGQTQTWAPTACKDGGPDSKWQLLKQ